jgi:nitronate monooxygenase
MFLRAGPNLVTEVCRHGVLGAFPALNCRSTEALDEWLAEIVSAAHAYGGLVLHDVTTRRHAEKAAAAGVDGLIAVCGGAGGHAGSVSPFALVGEIEQFFPGLLAVAGSITTGRDPDIVLTAKLSGVEANFLRPSVRAAGVELSELDQPAALDLADDRKVWKDFWSAGHGVGRVSDVPRAGTLCDRLLHEYRQAMSVAAAQDAFLSCPA